MVRRGYVVAEHTAFAQPPHSYGWQSKASAVEGRNGRGFYFHSPFPVRLARLSSFTNTSAYLTFGGTVITIP